MKPDPPNRTFPLGPGESLPSFTLLPFRGGKAVSYQPGRVTVVSFCALWCDTWREQSTRLRRIRRGLAGLPIDYLAVSVDGRWAERFADGQPTDTDVLLDSGGLVSRTLGIRAVPWTFVADQRGIVQYTRQGILREEEFTPLLRRLVTGKPTEKAGGDAAIYLTFDDFPTVRDREPISEDEELLDILRAARVPATFFCIGEHLTQPSGANAVRRAAREGHSLQIHSWDHDISRPDLPRCVHTLTALTGKPPRLYRPPGSSALLNITNLQPVMPASPVVNPYDFQRPGLSELMRRILYALQPGAVIQLHAGVRETREALPDLIASIRRRNLAFETLA